MKNPTQEALSSYKLASRLAIAAGGVQALSLGSAKLVDAIDKLLEYNLGTAAIDIWNGTASILNVLSQALSSNPRINYVADPSADRLYYIKQFREASGRYWVAMRNSKLIDADHIKLILSEDIINEFHN